MKKTTSIRIDEQLLNDFQHKYYGLMSEYINRALKFALENNQNFQLVFFGSDVKTDKEN